MQNSITSSPYHSITHSPADTEVTIAHLLFDFCLLTSVAWLLFMPSQHPCKFLFLIPGSLFLVPCQSKPDPVSVILITYPPLIVECDGLGCWFIFSHREAGICDSTTLPSVFKKPIIVPFTPDINAKKNNLIDLIFAIRIKVNVDRI